jgi:hypothetical protein
MQWPDIKGKDLKHVQRKLSIYAEKLFTSEVARKTHKDTDNFQR